VLATLPNDLREWNQIPVVVLTGVALGLALVWAAIRFMIRKK
jgi:hypothetical protein